MSQGKKIEYNAKHVAFVFDNESTNAVLVTEDGNVFKKDAKGQSFCNDHCRRLNIKFEEVTREQFEAANPKKDEAKPIVLTKLNKAQLLAICEDKGIEATEADKNADLIKLIEDAEKGAQEGDKTPEGDSTNDNTAE